MQIPCIGDYEFRNSSAYLNNPTLEEQLLDKAADFSQFHDVGIMIDGITYIPPHPIWDYQVMDQHPRHPHWTGIVEIAVYPFINLGNPHNIDPSHPENIAEVLSQTMAPQYQAPDWMSRKHSPDPKPSTRAGRLDTGAFPGCRNLSP